MPSGGGPEKRLTTAPGLDDGPEFTPNGKRVVFISYGPEIAPDDHPWYKRVFIRAMPIDGGTPNVAAYVYGGQGTFEP